MKLVAAVISFMLASVPASAQNASDNANLNDVVQAYTDSKALGQKASTFLHARAAYRLARRIYPKEPDKLASFSLYYAKAAANFHDPLALFLYKNTLNFHVAAYGLADTRLIKPLIDAADEALRQNEPEIAYAWYTTASKLLARDQPNGSFSAARILMGLARLHRGADQLEHARAKAKKAIDLLYQYYPDGSPTTIASLIHRHGEIEQATEHHAKALEAFSQSLALFIEHDVSAPEIYELHNRLIEINHKFGREDEVIAHCLAAQKFQYTNRRKAISGIVYDPTGRLSGSERQKQGRIRATFRKGLDCRLHDIEIHHADGITTKEAEKLLAQAYYAPIMMRGIVSTGEYLTFSTLAVYKN